MTTFNTSDDWKERLANIFSEEELKAIAEYFEQVKKHGWGGVRIEFAGGEPDKWTAWPIFSNQFGRARSKFYKSE